MRVKQNGDFVDAQIGRGKAGFPANTSPRRNFHPRAKHILFLQYTCSHLSVTSPDCSLMRRRCCWLQKCRKNVINPLLAAHNVKKLGLAVDRTRGLSQLWFDNRETSDCSIGTLSENHTTRQWVCQYKLDDVGRKSAYPQDQQPNPWLGWQAGKLMQIYNIDIEGLRRLGLAESGERAGSTVVAC